MRHICLDTETTGFDPAKGDRLCEVACIELKNFLPTGRTFHKYINPNRKMSPGAFKVHGLSDEFLRDKPLFHLVAQEFLDFVGDSPLVIHNAAFDMKFLNAELKWAKKPILSNNEIVDTLLIARQKYPGAPATLDALCKRFKISLEGRTKHGALIDTELLAEIFLNLSEGRAPSLKFSDQKSASSSSQGNNIKTLERPYEMSYKLSEEEINTHKAHIDSFKSKSLWLVEEV